MLFFMLVVPCLSASVCSLPLRSSFHSSAGFCAPAAAAATPSGATKKQANRGDRARYHYTQEATTATYQATRRATHDEIQSGSAGEVPLASPIAAAIESESTSNSLGNGSSTALSVPEGSVAYFGRSVSPVSPVPADLFLSRAIKGEAFASRKSVAIAPQKLNDICRTVRGLGVQEALIQLRLSPKKKAHLVEQVIRNAMSNAINHFDMERSRLYVDRLWTGTGSHLKRIDIKGRGRTGMKRKYRAHLFCVVKEQGRDPEKYKGIWKLGGNSHDPRTGAELRIGRRGRLSSTIQRTIEQMKQWRQERGMAPEARPLSRWADAKKAHRAAGIATDHEAEYGAAAIAAAKAEGERLRAALRAGASATPTATTKAAEPAPQQAQAQ
jgi:ribosomal protein L22